MAFYSESPVSFRLLFTATLFPNISKSASNWSLKEPYFRYSEQEQQDAHRRCQLRQTIETSFTAAVAALLAALQMPSQFVGRETQAMEPITFAAASNRRVIGSMNEFAWQLGSYMARTDNPLELALQLSQTPMSAVGSKSSYGFPDTVARELLMSWNQ